MMAFILGLLQLLLLVAAFLVGIFAASDNSVRHWLYPELDYWVVAFLCGFLPVYWVGRMLIDGLENLLKDFVAWLRGTNTP